MAELGTVTIRGLCRDIEDAIEILRLDFRNGYDISHLLNQMRGLQDNLNRLVEAVDDSESQSRCIRELEDQRIVPKVLNLLETARRLGCTNNSGVKASCEAINLLLVSLAQIKHVRMAAAAG